MASYGAALASLLLLALPAHPREVASSAPSPGQAPVNEAVDAMVSKARDAAILESWKRSPGDVEKALLAVWRAFVFPLKNRSIAAIELALERDPIVSADLNYGELPDGERVAHPVYAPSLLVRKGDLDLAIGLDKFGHFFEEGFFVRQVAEEEPARGDALAEGVSKWLEGMAPDAASVAWIRKKRTLRAYWCHEDGRHEYDLVGSFAAHAPGKARGFERGSSPADVAANLAGRKWFDDLAALLARAPKDVAGLQELLAMNPFRIADVASESWDESRNPNVETLDRAPR